MKKLTQENTVAVLKGLPVFCIDRQYTITRPGMIIDTQYKFAFANGYGASVVKFVDKSYSGGRDYELGVIGSDGDLDYSTHVTGDVERGDEYHMNDLLNKIEAL